MTVQALYTAASGMTSLETNLDVIANNLANVNTTAFKQTRGNFEDLFYRNIKLPASQDSLGNYTPTGVAVGLGVRVQSTQTDFSQGSFRETDRPLDVAIEGRGFFQVIDPDTGQIVFTRAGDFSINSVGQLVIGSAQTGRVVNPAITFPPDAVGILISPNGLVQFQQAGAINLSQAGQLQLATFINPEGLVKMGENLYRQTDSSGPAQIGIPGQNGIGNLRQGTLEASNVQPVNELIELITTQRAFELNSQVVQAGDQLLQLVANLRRF